MHSETTIQYVMSSVGWNNPINMPGVGPISDDNKANISGRVFSGYHSLVTSEDLFKLAGDDAIDNDKLNEVLLDLKRQGALQALTLIFDDSPQYDPLGDYSGTVVKYIGLIQKVFGLTVGVMALQTMLTSKRVNDVERKTKFGILKTELDGIKNDYGHVVSRGLIAKQSTAVYEAQKIIFPQTPEIHGNPLW